jgi:hypothetical protein
MPVVHVTYDTLMIMRLQVALELLGFCHRPMRFVS